MCLLATPHERASMEKIIIRWGNSASFVQFVSNVHTDNCVFSLSGTLVRSLTRGPEVALQSHATHRLSFLWFYSSGWIRLEPTACLLQTQDKPSYRQLQIMCRDSFKKVGLSVWHTWSMFSLWDWRIITALQNKDYDIPFHYLFFFLHFYLFTKLICIFLARKCHKLTVLWHCDEGSLMYSV